MKKKQSKIIAKYFENIFCANAAPINNVLPTSMLTPITSSEISKTVWTHYKSPEMDQIKRRTNKILTRSCV